MSKIIHEENEKKMKRKGRGDRATSTVAAGIPLIGWILFGALPLLLAAVISFSELHSTDMNDMKFVGLQNFITILTNADGHTYLSYLTTVILWVNVPITIGVSIYISNLINKVPIGKNFFRAVFFVPHICSLVVVAMTFRMMFSAEGGVINSVLDMLGFKQRTWLSDSPWAFMGVVTLLNVWAGIGFCIVLFNAAISKIDSTYYEAARLDGATPFQMFWKITWPAISPTTSYLVTMRTISALQGMATTYVLTNRATGTPTWPGTNVPTNETIVRHIYNMVFENSYVYGYGLAAAAGWVLAVVIFIITILNMKMQERWVNYDF